MSIEGARRRHPGHRAAVVAAQPLPLPVDVAAAQRAVTDLLRALGADFPSAHLQKAPAPVATAYAELASARRGAARPDLFP
jgi:GTP cyclohydrolase I